MAQGKKRFSSGETLPLARRLWAERVSQHRGTLALVLLLIVAGAAATSLYPLLIREAFNAFDRRDLTLIAYAPLVVIAVTAAKGFALFGQLILTNRIVTRVEADMQGALYNQLLRLDLAELQGESPASLTQRFTTDFTFIRDALTRMVTVFLRDTVTIAALIGAMLWIDWQMTLIAAIVAPFAIPPIARIGKRLRRVSTVTQEQIGAMAGMVSESLAGARVVKAYGMEAYLSERGRAAFEEVRDLRMRAARARARLEPLLEIGGGLAVAGVLAFIGFRIGRGETSIGDFTGFVTALLLAAQPVRALGNLNAIVQEALAALDRHYAVIDRPPSIASQPDAPALRVGTGEVAFNAVSFRYRAASDPGGPVDGEAPAATAALDAVSLVAPGGRTTALVGRSGSGKSTLLSLVPRLYDPDEGRVTIDGQNVRTVSLASLREQIALVSQDIVLFDDSVRANIAFGRPGADEAAIVAAAQAAAAHEFIMRMPQGYDTPIGTAGGRLSGGERQRLSLARAFLKDAPILLLDEPTSALDSESERLVRDAIARLMHGRTTLVIAHRLATVRNADLIVVMEAGRIVEEGRHEELIARGGAYARLHRLQFADGDGEGITRGE